MSDKSTRAELLGLLALYPDGRTFRLRSVLESPAVLGPLPLGEARGLLREYLLDPQGAALVARTSEQARWLGESLILRKLAPGNAVPVSDAAAAVLAVGGEGGVSDELRRRRFAPRADELIAATVAACDDETAQAEIVRLADESGPDEECLHLALLQAGRALAWAGARALGPATEPVVDRLLSLLAHDSPAGLLQSLVPALGPIGATGTPAGAKVRDHAARAVLRAAWAEEGPPAKAGSFLAEFSQLDRPRQAPAGRRATDEDLAEAAAEILGRAAPEDPEGFARVRRVVFDDRARPGALFPSFLQGLAAGGNVHPLAALAEQLLGGEPEEQQIALFVASKVPLDACAEPIFGLLEADDPDVRALAVAAAALLPGEVSLEPIARRLDDPSVTVGVAAARALFDLGRPDATELLPPPGEGPRALRVRVAAMRAVLGECSREVIGDLVLALGEELSRGITESPLADALGALLASNGEAFLLVCDLLGEVPDALDAVAVSVFASDEEEHRVALRLPDELRSALYAALAPLIAGTGEDALTSLALLCRLCATDRSLVTEVRRLLAESGAPGAQILPMLADLRVCDADTAALLAPVLDGADAADSLVAAAIAGIALPAAHPGWRHVRALLDLNPSAAQIAHASLVNRARRAPDSSSLDEKAAGNP